MFRTTTSAIQASQGWVRCGRCRKIFDCRSNKIDPTEYVENQSYTTSGTLTPPSVSPVKRKTDYHWGDKKPQRGDKNPQIPLFDDEISHLDENKEKISTPALNKASWLELNNDDETVENDEPHVKIGPYLDQPLKKDPDQPKFERDDISDTVELKKQNTPSSARPPIVDTVAPSADKKATTAVDQPIWADRQSKSGSNEITAAKDRDLWLSQTTLSKAQRWKKEKNRFKPQRNYTMVLVVVILTLALLWQLAIVNYGKLSSYQFIAAPLSLVCSLIHCNNTPPSITRDFEILQANVRRHDALPNVIRVSGRLINYSNDEKPLPSVRLDLIDDKEKIIASRMINLADSPQYVNPPTGQIAPGQDVNIDFNIDNPHSSVLGYELKLQHD